MKLLRDIIELSEALNPRRAQLDDAFVNVDGPGSNIGNSDVRLAGLVTADKGDGVSEVTVIVRNGQNRFKCNLHYSPYLDVVYNFDPNSATKFDWEVEGYGDDDLQTPEFENLRKILAYFMANDFHDTASQVLENHKEQYKVSSGFYD